MSVVQDVFYEMSDGIMDFIHRHPFWGILVLSTVIVFLLAFLFVLTSEFYDFMNKTLF